MVSRGGWPDPAATVPECFLMSTPTDGDAIGDLVLTTFDWVPEAPRGYVRDLRVRWALEEAGLPYRVETTRFASGVHSTSRVSPSARSHG